jgi:hypothetical protein
MRRRTFITLLGGAAAAWPIAARAQQAGKIPRVGFMGNSTAALEANLVGPFRDGLRELGYQKGRNLVISADFTKKLARPLSTTDGGVLRTALDVQEFLLHLPEAWAQLPRWENVRQALGAATDVREFSWHVERPMFREASQITALLTWS